MNFGLSIVYLITNNTNTHNYLSKSLSQDVAMLKVVQQGPRSALEVYKIEIHYNYSHLTTLIELQSSNYSEITLSIGSAISTISPPIDVKCVALFTRPE